MDPPNTDVVDCGGGAGADDGVVLGPVGGGGGGCVDDDDDVVVELDEFGKTEVNDDVNTDVATGFCCAGFCMTTSGLNAAEGGSALIWPMLPSVELLLPTGSPGEGAPGDGCGLLLEPDDELIENHDGIDGFGFGCDGGGVGTPGDGAAGDGVIRFKRSPLFC